MCLSSSSATAVERGKPRENWAWGALTSRRCKIIPIIVTTIRTNGQEQIKLKLVEQGAISYQLKIALLMAHLKRPQVVITTLHLRDLHHRFALMAAYT
jgi:hypothetical protein